MGDPSLSPSRAGRAPNKQIGGLGLFVYGTLLDAEVRALVIGRAMDDAQLVPAILKNMRRVYIAGRLYPMVIPRRGDSVPGLLLSGLSAEDYARLDAFEGADYRRERQAVWPADAAEPVNAWFYRTRGAGPRPTARLWELEAWRARDKAPFLRDARAWIAELAAR
ncbi:MAG: gamma-glutamylcyclotransferase family protein [Alphaproteobacteria bacterium]